MAGTGGALRGRSSLQTVRMGRRSWADGQLAKLPHPDGGLTIALSDPPRPYRGLRVEPGDRMTDYRVRAIRWPHLGLADRRPSADPSFGWPTTAHHLAQSWGKESHVHSDAADCCQDAETVLFSSLMKRGGSPRGIDVEDRWCIPANDRTVIASFCWKMAADARYVTDRASGLCLRLVHPTWRCRSIFRG